MEKIEVKGFELEKGDNLIVAASNSGRRLELGQLVVSNGRFVAPAGTRGIVVKIHKPSTKGLTSNILEVHFEGRRYSLQMKFKDLE